MGGGVHKIRAVDIIYLCAREGLDASILCEILDGLDLYVFTDCIDDGKVRVIAVKHLATLVAVHTSGLCFAENCGGNEREKLLHSVVVRGHKHIGVSKFKTEVVAEKMICAGVF